MKELSHFKKLYEINMTIGKKQGQKRAYKNLSPNDLSELDDVCLDKFGKPFDKCSYDEQGAARSYLWGKTNEEEEEDFNIDLGDDEDDENETTDEKLESDFIELLDNKNFIENIQIGVKQYVLENLLKEKVNSFKIIPFVEFSHEDEDFGVSVEFDAPCIFNFDKNDKLKESEIATIRTIKYTTPDLTDLTTLENEKGVTIISTLISDILNDIDERVN